GTGSGTSVPTGVEAATAPRTNSPAARGADRPSNPANTSKPRATNVALGSSVPTWSDPSGNTSATAKDCRCWWWTRRSTGSCHRSSSPPSTNSPNSPCERNNHYLDRALLVDTISQDLPAGLGYFP